MSKLLPPVFTLQYLIASIAALVMLWHPAHAEQAKGPGSPVFKPAVVYLSGEKEAGHSFLESAIKGAEKAQTELGIEVQIFTMRPKEDIYESLKSIARKGYSPIIAVGNQNVLPVQNLAESYPKTRFSIVDGLAPPLYPNVQSIIFKDHEGSFLMGFIAATVSKKNHIGFVGGMDIPLIRNFAEGYKQGAEYAKKGIRVDVDMIGDTATAWNDPERAFKLAQDQFDSGADIIFGAAGASTQGTLKAAQMFHKLAIGVDTNQNGLYPGFVLTSLVKRVDLAVYEALKSAQEGQWQPGIKTLGLKEGALDYAVDENNKELLDNNLVDKVSNVKERIINGIIDVQSYSVR